MLPAIGTPYYVCRGNGEECYSEIWYTCIVHPCKNSNIGGNIEDLKKNYWVNTLWISSYTGTGVGFCNNPRPVYVYWRVDLRRDTQSVSLMLIPTKLRSMILLARENGAVILNENFWILFYRYPRLKIRFWHVCAPQGKK